MKLVSHLVSFVYSIGRDGGAKRKGRPSSSYLEYICEMWYFLPTERRAARAEGVNM